MEHSLQDNEEHHVSYSAYNPHTDGTHLVPSVVDCFKRVFAADPWNEYLVCPKCKKHWGIKEVGMSPIKTLSCPSCSVQLEEFWPTETVTEDFLEEMRTIPEQNRQPWCWLAHSGPEKVVGICWGYSIAIPELGKKLGLPFFANRFKKRFGEVPVVAYQDELAVLSEWRNKGIAKQLVVNRHKDFLQAGLPIGVIRTKRNPPTVTHDWYVAKGYKVIESYNDPEDRVILARRFDDFQF